MDLGGTGQFIYFMQTKGVGLYKLELYVNDTVVATNCLKSEKTSLTGEVNAATSAVGPGLAGGIALAGRFNFPWPTLAMLAMPAMAAALLYRHPLPLSSGRPSSPWLCWPEPGDFCWLPPPSTPPTLLFTTTAPSPSPSPPGNR
jgi:hypothetical protein